MRCPGSRSALVGALVGRAIAVYGLLGGFLWLRRRFGPTDREPHRGWLHVLNWSGLRGAVAVAMALSLPMSVPQRGLDHVSPQRPATSSARSDQRRRQPAATSDVVSPQRPAKRRHPRVHGDEGGDQVGPEGRGESRPRPIPGPRQDHPGQCPRKAQPRPRPRQTGPRPRQTGPRPRHDHPQANAPARPRQGHDRAMPAPRPRHDRPQANAPARPRQGHDRARCQPRWRWARIDPGYRSRACTA